MPDQPKTHQEPTTENAILMERIRELEAKDEVRNWAGELIRVRLSLLEFAATHSLEELLQKTLDEVGVLSDSPIGFYHFVGKDQKTILLQAWSTRTVKEFCKAEGKGMHYGIDQAGVWVDCVRQKRPVIHNDYNSLPHRKGLPEGHPPVIRELVVPIMRDGSVAAILGMGNKPTDYTPRDIEIVSYLADVAWAIIERKRAEEALRESETKYRVLVETAADSIFIAQDGMIKFCNKNFADVSGYGPADLTNMAFSDLVHPDDRQMVFERYMQRLEGKDVPSRYRFRFIDARGNTHWADMSVALISWEGKPASLCLAADITGLKQAEEALRKSEEKFRHLFERAEEGILIVRGETLEFVNPAIERIMGHPMDKLTSGPFINFIHPDDQAEAIDRHLRRMRGEALAAVNDFRVITSDGTVKWITASSQVVEWEGKPANLNFITDITARKLAEEALRESEERYKGLVESSFAGVYVVQNGRFVFLNENAAAFTGYRPEELVGRRSDTIVHPEDLYGVTQKARDMLDSQYSSPYEFRIVTKGGQVRWIMETVASIHYNGSPAILGNSMDITGQKNAEIERQAALESLQAVRDLEKGILQSVPHALFGVERRQIFFANDAMEAVFGWKPEEVIGKSTRVIFRTDEEWAEYGAMLYSRLEKEPLTVFEWDKPFVRKDGSAFFCRMSFSISVSVIPE
jgi:PAS domain S-box-containing protein